MRFFFAISTTVAILFNIINIVIADPLKPVQLVTLLDFKPFIWCEKDTPKGIDIDIVNELFSRVDRPVSIKCIPWKRAIRDVKSGKADGLFSAYVSAERKKFAIYLDHPLHMSVFSVFVRKGADIQFDNIESLYNLNIGITRGYSINSEFDTAKKEGKFTVYECLSTANGIELLLEGRIDAYVNGRIVVLSTARELGVTQDISELPSPVHKPKPAFLMISRSARVHEKEVLIDSLNQELEQMTLDGTSAKIINSYIQDTNILN